MVHTSSYNQFDQLIHGHKTAMRWGDTNITMHCDPSTNKLTKLKQEELKRINDIAPWTEIEWITHHRDPVDGLTILVQDHLNSECVSGYSNYHYKLIGDTTPANQEIATEFGLDIGDECYLWPKPLCVGLKGDDSPMSKVAFNCFVVSNK